MKPTPNNYEHSLSFNMHPTLHPTQSDALRPTQGKLSAETIHSYFRFSSAVNQFQILKTSADFIRFSFSAAKCFLKGSKNVQANLQKLTKVVVCGL